MPRRLSLIAATAALALLSACGKGDEQGTDISISGTDAEGNLAVARIDGKSGHVKLDVPGVKLDLPLPKIDLDAEDFDIGGVKLYPGSKVSAFDIVTDKNGKDEDQVKITFNAPAAPGVVANWFAEKMKAEGFTLKINGASIAGQTDEGDPFTLDLKPGAAGQSNGVLNLTS